MQISVLRPDFSTKKSCSVLYHIVPDQELGLGSMIALARLTSIDLLKSKSVWQSASSTFLVFLI